MVVTCEARNKDLRRVVALHRGVDLRAPNALPKYSTAAAPGGHCHYLHLRWRPPTFPPRPSLLSSGSLPNECAMAAATFGPSLLTAEVRAPWVWI
jgi:hypothetical protein